MCIFQHKGFLPKRYNTLLSLLSTPFMKMRKNGQMEKEFKKWNMVLSTPQLEAVV